MNRFLLPLTAAVTCVATVGAQTPPKAAPVFVDGQAQVVPAFQDPAQWIHQDLWVETIFDSDHDGKKDRVHVDVTRPAQTASEGLKVPIVMGSSPYYAGTGRPQVNWDVKVELGATPSPRGKMNNPPFQSPRDTISAALVNQWGLARLCRCPQRCARHRPLGRLPHRGRHRRTVRAGCGRRLAQWSRERLHHQDRQRRGHRDVVVHRQGRHDRHVVRRHPPTRRGHHRRQGTRGRRARLAQHLVLHYYRSNGLVRSPWGYLGEDVDVLYDFIASGDTANRANCDRIWKNGIFAGKNGQDRASGDMNDFWSTRDLLLYLKNVKAAVLLAHGFNDYNVVPEHSVRIYDEMKRSSFLFRSTCITAGTAAIRPPNGHRWFSHYLYGVDNGVEKAPPVWIMQDAASQYPPQVAVAKRFADSVAANPPPRDTTNAGRGDEAREEGVAAADRRPCRQPFRVIPDSRLGAGGVPSGRRRRVGGQLDLCPGKEWQRKVRRRCRCFLR